ncbi:MMPL family transporter [Sulfidibacter corallicola]|uniref:MMPL family transporter n=1 Tax=Sulfidibacter corallicola TaxID=2818388 RepID=A0A8A4TW61_SULCO|nr:MMPL family transporter [Sulfidibacter corallicola]QTD53723.1 MMPL family transporter [Sulfidibacter corallicola]
MKTLLTDFSLKHPWWIFSLVLLATAGLALQFPKVHFDNDPENMLRADEPIRLYHHEVKERFSLYDFVIVGIVNEDHEDGIFNVETLGRIDDLTGQLLSLEPTDRGEIRVTTPSRGDRAAQTATLDLNPSDLFHRLLNVAFRHNPNRLFDEEGHSAIVGRELIAPGVVDNLKQAELGALKLEYLMERPPRTRAEALTIRDDAMGNPLYRGTLVSEDGMAICLYIPISEKTFSYNVANLVETLTADWPASDQVHITGLPVAEDTFGVEMLVQMATSAPMAGLAIFLLLLLFFRRLSLIIAPMVVAVISIVCTMGLLIGLGFDVHIMSSMIAIFLMPIAVADSVHILSEFFDTYHRFQDKAKTVRSVVGHLFMPMLYTSLTTMAGFGSLAFTPIPPVRVFGAHVAFGVGLAWLLTMTLIPAYIMVFVPAKSLANLQPTGLAHAPGPMARFLERFGRISYRHWKGILTATALLLAVAAFGISRINVNDNPVKWFTEDHAIRTADRVLNHHFGGTYTAYLTLTAPESSQVNAETVAADVTERIRDRLSLIFPDAVGQFLGDIQATLRTHGHDASALLDALGPKAAAIDAQLAGGWDLLADEINYLDPEGLDRSGLKRVVAGLTGVDPAITATLFSEIERVDPAEGADLQDTALEICDTFTERRFSQVLAECRTAWFAPAFKRPEVLRYVEDLQRHLAEHPLVGKTTSAVDALKKASFELNYRQPGAEAPHPAPANETYFAVPNTVEAVGQVFTQLEGMKKKDSLFHLVTRDYRMANLWVQLKSGDNQDMEAVVTAVADYMAAHPAPDGLVSDWAGLTYLNVVWQEKMVNGMMTSLASSFVVVLLMMIVLFRSPLFGLLSMIPLTVTISLIYGLIGLVGKDYDMPVAVLSALTLGLSIDFAIHFLQRGREMTRQRGSWKAAVAEMFREPATAISRNAVTISIGFTPLLFAPLVPYRTVGFFLATIMAVSWVATLFILAALSRGLERWLYPAQNVPAEPEPSNRKEKCHV